MRSFISAYKSAVWIWMCVCGLDEFTVLMHHIIAHKHRSACGVPPAQNWGHASLQMEIFLIHIISFTFSFAFSLETTQHTRFNPPVYLSQKDCNNAFLWHDNFQFNEANTQLHHIEITRIRVCVCVCTTPDPRETVHSLKSVCFSNTNCSFPSSTAKSRL